MGGSPVHRGHNSYLSVFFVIAPFHKYNQCLADLNGRGYQFIAFACFSCSIWACADPEGGTVVQTPPWKITKNIYRVLKQYRSRSPEKSQLPSQHLMLGHHWHASEKPFYGVLLGADDGPLIVVLGSFPPPHQKERQKTLSKLDPLWQNFLDLRMMSKYW